MSEMSDPALEWEYRNITCRVYRLEQIATLAYAKVGDVWIEVFNDDGREPHDIESRVESEVDGLLDDIQDTGVDWERFPVDPDPTPQPLDPDPIDPSPLDPYPDPGDDSRDPFDGPQWRSTLVALKHSDRYI